MLDIAWLIHLCLLSIVNIMAWGGAQVGSGPGACGAPSSGGADSFAT